MTSLTGSDQTFSEIKKEEEEAKDAKASSKIQKPTTRRKDMKPDADSSSSNTSIPDKSGTDVQALEEKVKSMMEKDQKMITVGKQTKDAKLMR